MSDYHVTMRSPGADDIDFRLRGGPIDDFQNHKDLFAAIGYAATAWARFEAHLDAILIHVNAEAHSRKIYNRDHPITFDRKVKLLKRWFNQHPGLSHLKEDMRRISSTSKELSRMRNQFLHSVLEDWDAVKQVVRFKECRWTDSHWEVTSFDWTIPGLQGFGDNMDNGNRALESISRELFTLDGLERLRIREQHIPRLVRLYRRWRAYLGF